MKLLEITAAYKPAHIYGGPTMSVAKLCEALKEDEIDVEVLTTTANGKSELPVIANERKIIAGVPVTYYRRLTKDHTHFSPALLLALRNIIHHNKSATSGKKLIVHIHAWWNLVSILSCLVAKINNIPVVLSPRGMLTNYTLGNRNSKLKLIIHTILGKNLLQYCHIHATSEKEKQDILQLVDPKSITVIPNLVDFPKQSNNPMIKHVNNSTSFNLLFLSRIEEKKGLELLLETLAGLEIDWKLTIAGSGEENYIKDLQLKIEALKLSDRINWLGHVNNKDKFNLLTTSDLTVLTSYNENFANVVIESLSVGTAVLISDQVGLADYVARNKLGWITSLTVAAIKAQLIDANQDQQKRAKIRNIAPDLIETDFNSATLVKQYITLYKQVN